MSDFDARLQPNIPVLQPASHTLTSLHGLRAAGVAAGIKASGNPDVALLVSDTPVSVAAIYTQNKFAAAPVLVSREHLRATRGLMRALVINSGNANACTGEQGLADARRMCAHVAEKIGCVEEQVLVCSTGVIGNLLPMEKVLHGIDNAFLALDNGPQAGRQFLRAIMTTDAFEKESSDSSEGAIVSGICKGAGMIAPNMATMLAVMGTDASATPDELQSMIDDVARVSFNAVHVDSHPSTNDTFLLFATSMRDNPVRTVRSSMMHVARRLAWLIARDGEGATKVTTIKIRGAQSTELAKQIAEKIASSALVRTALYGNDPNWGRFVSQVGNVENIQSVDGLTCTLQGTVVFANGAPTQFDRASLSQRMRCDDVELCVALTEGNGEATLMTSDLSYRYVQVNAEYTT